MYKIITDEINPSYTLYSITHEIWIPTDPANRHYQEVLAAIIEQGADCFEGDIPQELLDAAEAKRLSANADD
jgi:hypothetical protein